MPGRSGSASENAALIIAPSPCGRGHVENFNSRRWVRGAGLSLVRTPHPLALVGSPAPPSPSGSAISAVAARGFANELDFLAPGCSAGRAIRSWWNMLGAFFKKGDVISGAVLAALGVYIITQARAWDYYTLDGPGPGFFPFWYGVAMVVLSLLLIVNSARTGNDGESKGGMDWPATGRAMMTWLAFAVSVALMDFLGFLISFALLAFFLVAVIFRRPFTTAAVVAVA